jgi:hypothetical protein
VLEFADEMDEQKYCYSRMKVAGLAAILFTGLVVFPTWVLVYAGWKGGWKLPNDKLYIAILPMFLYLIAFFCIRMLARAFMDRQPVIAISSVGIYDRTISDHVIPWNALSGVQFFKYGKPGNRIRLNIKPVLNEKLILNGYWATNISYFNYVEIVQPLLEVNSRRLFNLVLEKYSKSKIS